MAKAMIKGESGMVAGFTQMHRRMAESGVGR